MSRFMVRASRLLAATVTTLVSLTGSLASPSSAAALPPAASLATPAVVAAATTLPGGVVPLRPSRVLDTRTGRGAPVGIVSGGQTRSVRVAGLSGIPSSGAAAGLVSITVTGSTASGYVTAYASGAVRPGTSNLNYVAGRTVTNLALVPVGADGAISLSVSGGATHLVSDVSGYVAAGPAAGPGSCGWSHRPGSSTRGPGWALP